MMELQQVLEQYWGYSAFRPMQAEIMQEVISGKDALAILPTGGGKSLCYQVPGMYMKGICLVVTPLVALMQDQVSQLNRRNIPAAAIHTGMEFRELRMVLEKAIHDQLKFLYVSPERLQTRMFREYLPSLLLNLIAVDEAHCISQWGYDFRPSYLNIASIREEKPDTPVLALTASATPVVQRDILDKLQMSAAAVFRQSFERPNLSYSHFLVDSRYEKLISVLKSVQGTAIVYCRSRKKTREVYDLLVQQKITAAFYHGGLNAATRKERQEQWILGEVRVMVSTNAFGMGIDKPDVRLVVHLSPPDSLENYYQEAGRAGRDQQKAYAVLLTQPRDDAALKQQPAIRYPPLETIRSIYQALCNHLQVALHEGHDVSYDMDLSAFIQAFDFEAKKVLYSLEALQQSGILVFQEQVFQPSTVFFLAGRQQLQQLESSNSPFDPLIKILLRTYGGILDFPTAVSEKELSKLLFTGVNEVKVMLTDMHQARIIEFSPQKENPQIRFLTNRVQSRDLMIDMDAYEKRKQNYTERIAEMISYLDTKECRAVVIGKYFGDDQISKCGICDNCINRRKKAMSKQEFETIAGTLKILLQAGNMTVKDILKSNPQFKPEKIMTIIGEWEAEKKISIDESGRIEIKKKGPG